jgi:hypothetical protein
MTEPVHTGGMIALIPDNPGQYTVPGGDSSAEMHCTLCFLGDDVSGLPAAVVDGLKGSVSQLASNSDPVTARIMGSAIWNRDGGPDGTMDPATVTVLQPGDGDGDEDDQVLGLQQRASSIARNVMGAALYPEQFDPWQGHITAGFNLPDNVLPTAKGEATFSTLRLALGGSNYDFPLNGRDTAMYATDGVMEMAAKTDDREAAPTPPEKIDNALPAFWPCLAVEGMKTSDGRYLNPGEIEFRQPPLSVYAQTVNTGQGGHSGAEVVGKLTEIWKIPGPEFVSKETGQPMPEGTFVWQGRGELDGDSKGGDYARRGYLTGNSIDLSEASFTDDITFGEDGEEEHQTSVSGKIGATTLCAIPAFADAYVEIDGARPTIAADDEVPEDQRTPEGLAAYLLQRGIQPVTASVSVPELGDACSPCLAGEFALPPALAKNAAKKKAAAQDDEDSEDDPKGKPAFLKKKLGKAMELPPVAAFADPKLTAPTPLTVDDETGEIFGHIATWGTCHIGVQKQCTPPPKSRSDYAHFNVGAMRAMEGDTVRTVAVGHLTMNTGHADLGDGFTAATRHYDHTGTVAADVAAGEDMHGIWVHGFVRPELSEDQRRALLASAPSGDWRPINGHLEMVAVLAVNTPGYAVPRARVASGAGMTALVAAGATRPAADFGPDGLDLDELATRVAAKISGLLGDWAHSPKDGPDQLAVDQAQLAAELEQDALAEELMRPFSKATGSPSPS